MFFKEVTAFYIYASGNFYLVLFYFYFIKQDILASLRAQIFHRTEEIPLGLIDPFYTGTLRLHGRCFT